MSTSLSVALLGGRGSGKTTYLGALVDALDAGRVRHIARAGRPKDARALRRLAEPLQAGRYPNRTTTEERHHLELPLRGVGSVFQSTDFTLRIADYDGQEVDRLFQDRTRGWSEEWRARAKSNHLLLCLAPNPGAQPRMSQPLLDSQARWLALSRQAVPHTHSTEVTPLPVAPSRPETYFGPGLVSEIPERPHAQPCEAVPIPMALEMIELLQFIREERGLAPGERAQQGKVAILISMWDAIHPAWQQQGPAAYLAEAAPLLADYLWSNFLPDDVFCFGMSATGGDLRDPAYNDLYQEHRGGFVSWADARGQIQQQRDIAVPLYWVLWGDRALTPDPSKHTD